MLWSLVLERNTGCFLAICSILPLSRPFFFSLSLTLMLKPKWFCSFLNLLFTSLLNVKSFKSLLVFWLFDENFQGREEKKTVHDLEGTVPEHENHVLYVDHFGYWIHRSYSITSMACSTFFNLSHHVMWEVASLYQPLCIYDSFPYGTRMLKS